MILAAGRGERMRPLTNVTPKPLLKVGGKPLLQYHIENLAQTGIEYIVINHVHLGKLIEDYFGNGKKFGVSIHYSAEGDTPLETGGGIKLALPILRSESFIVVNADIWTDYDFNKLPRKLDGLAHLVLVANPPHHLEGDLCLSGDRIKNKTENYLTYSGIGVYKAELFSDCKQVTFPLTSILRPAIAKQRVSGEFYSGRWVDVGTPERLSLLNKELTR